MLHEGKAEAPGSGLAIAYFTPHGIESTQTQDLTSILARPELRTAVAGDLRLRRGSLESVDLDLLHAQHRLHDTRWNDAVLKMRVVPKEIEDRTVCDPKPGPDGGQNRAVRARIDV